MTQLNISQIKRSPEAQPRAELSREVIQTYKDDMLNGDQFPPVVVYFDGADHWLADGFHRVAAATQAKSLKISVDIRKGTKRDAVLHSVGANADHGYRRTNEDKRRAVERMLKDKEWSKLSDREIGRHCRVSNVTVSTLRKSICKSLTDSTERTVTRGGTTYTQNTANIGQSKPEPVSGEIVESPSLEPASEPKSEPEGELIDVPSEAVTPYSEEDAEEKESKLRFWGTAEMAGLAVRLDNMLIEIQGLPKPAEFSEQMSTKTEDLLCTEKLPYAASWLTELSDRLRAEGKL